jgi:heterotetrameric sarcosine oxidase delta subunit
MRISCPFCGERDSAEFVYRGDAGPRRPEGGDAEAFFDYVYLRDNPAGPMRETWHHAQGCRNWLVVTRDTATHEVHGAILARDAKR